jgi:hypothetical protein
MEDRWKNNMLRKGMDVTAKQGLEKNHEDFEKMETESIFYPKFNKQD